jgi:hypothetical protein
MDFFRQGPAKEHGFSGNRNKDLVQGFRSRFRPEIPKKSPVLERTGLFE